MQPPVAKVQKSCTHHCSTISCQQSLFKSDNRVLPDNFRVSRSHHGCGKVRDVRSDDVDRSRGAVFIMSVAFAGNGTHG